MKDAIEMNIGLAIALLFIVIVMGAFWERGARRLGFRRLAATTGYVYDESPSQSEGLHIVLGSSIAHGRLNSCRFEDLLRGTRRGHAFRTIRFHFEHGKSGDTQTVICVDLNTAHQNIRDRPRQSSDEKGTHVEYLNDKLLTYRPCVVVPPQHLVEWIEQAVCLAEGLGSSASTGIRS